MAAIETGQLHQKCEYRAVGIRTAQRTDTLGVGKP
jgi:hypothetical protein